MGTGVSMLHDVGNCRDLQRVVLVIEGTRARSGSNSMERRGKRTTGVNKKGNSSCLRQLLQICSVNSDALLVN
jgi:hypothetical protein